MIQSELDRALAELYISNQKLAYQLLERQIISPEQLDTILGDERIPLGQLLIQEKLIFKPELDQALAEQRVNNKKIGEILVEKQIISPYQLERTLKKQDSWQIIKR